LGSPGAFALTVGSGIRDFVCLPFTGILQGPWGFVNGVTHGSASLMKHLTAGQFFFQIANEKINKNVNLLLRNSELNYKPGVKRGS
jgi:hypothetical protein